MTRTSGRSQGPLVEWLESPSMGEVAGILRSWLSEKRFIVITGRCRVSYSGRSSSKLGPGDRVVIVKRDGSVLVHRPTGYSPVNWQPDSKYILVEERGNGILLRAVREAPREILDIVFEQIYFTYSIRGLEDSAEFYERLDEHEYRDVLAAHPEYIEEGLKVVEREKPVGPGFVDIYAVDSGGTPVVIEVKRVKADRNAVLQLNRYVSYFREKLGINVRGILVSPSISREANRLLEKLGLEYREVSLDKLRMHIKERQPHRVRSLLDFV